MTRVLLPIALGLAGCGQLPDANARAHTLAQSLGPASGPARNCIPVPAGEGLNVLADRTLAYRSAATTWVNHMPEQCRLSPMTTVIVERNGGQICRGDRVSTIETGASIPGSCILGPFVPHTTL